VKPTRLFSFIPCTSCFGKTVNIRLPDERPRTAREPDPITFRLP